MILKLLGHGLVTGAEIRCVCKLSALQMQVKVCSKVVAGCGCFNVGGMVALWPCGNVPLVLGVFSCDSGLQVCSFQP